MHSPHNSQVQSDMHHRHSERTVSVQTQNRQAITKSIGEISEWESRKDNYTVQKQMQLVQNRIRLLQIEQSKKQRRLEGTLKHSEHIQQVRENHSRYQSMKMAHKAETEQTIRELNRKTRDMKNKSETEKAFIQNCIKEMRKSDFYEMKKQQEENQKQIELQKNQSQVLNSKRKKEIIQQEMGCMLKVNNFRKQKFLEYSLQHQNSKLKNLKEKQAYSQKLEQLEKQEMEWLQKLQASTHNLKMSKLIESSSLPLQTAQSPARSRYSDGMRSKRKFHTNNSEGQFLQLQ